MICSVTCPWFVREVKVFGVYKMLSFLSEQYMAFICLFQEPDKVPWVFIIPDLQWQKDLPKRSQPVFHQVRFMRSPLSPQYQHGMNVREVSWALMHLLHHISFLLICLLFWFIPITYSCILMAVVFFLYLYQRISTVILPHPCTHLISQDPHVSRHRQFLEGWLNLETN